MLKIKPFLFTLIIITFLGAGCSSKKPTPTNQSPSTTNQSPSTTNQSATTNISKTYTMDEIQKSNTPDKCLTVIRGIVYDLTAWINKHPGGDKNILKLCGIDGTSLFVNKHGGMAQQEQKLQNFEMGKLE